MDSIQERIDGFHSRVTALQAQIAREDVNDMFGRMTIVELSREIDDCERKITKLQAHLNGTAPQGPSAEFVANLAYVMSAAYDND